MPRYRFDGFVETVLHGLSHEVNAVLHRGEGGEGHGQPAGSTVVVQPGDEITTDQPYPHAHLVNLETGAPDVAAPEPAAAPAPALEPAPAAAPAAAEGQE